MKNHSCFQPIIVLVLALLSFACTSSQHRAVLDSADSLMNARPDSALTLLNALLPDTDQMRKGDLMRFHLLRTNAENKCDTVLTARHAALMRRVCDYYDHKASPFWGDERGASRMLAHYLLGRCYSDMGEGPAALHEFYKSSEAADTTSTDCNLKVLVRVHSQMANMFYMQDLFDQQISELDIVISLARKCNDFYSEMWAIESKANAYDAKGKRKEALQLLKFEHNELIKHGYKTEAARSLGPTLGIMMDFKLYTELENSFAEYEKYSGFFDTEGNIHPSKALYYAYKGKFLAHRNKKDSALLLFRKCLQKSNSLEIKHAGAREMASYFEQKGGPKDSIAKYAFLSSRLNDSLRMAMRTTALERQADVRKYNNIQRLADKLKLQKERSKRQRQYWGFFSIIIFLAIGYVATGWYIKLRSLRREKVEKEKELQRINAAYLLALERHEETLSVLQLLKNEQDESADKLQRSIDDIEEREQRLARMTEEIIRLKEQLTCARREVNEKNQQDSIQLIDSRLNKLNILRQIDTCLTENPPCCLSLVDIRHLHEEIREVFPAFYERLVIEYKLPLRKYDICILYRLGIKPAHIATLLGVGRSSVTMERHRIYEQIFNRTDTEGEFENFIKSIM